MINIEVSKEDLMTIIASLVKLQLSRGVHDERLLDLTANLSIKAIDNMTVEEMEEAKNNIINK